MNKHLMLIRIVAMLTAVVALTDVQAQGYAPEEAARRMTLADGLQVHLVASEPMITQPVCIEFDDRGRVWVIQYLQYPNPAGLQRAKVDRWSRTTYDRAPEPPPRGPKGADRITILEDTDGDGRADRAHDFVAGLNLASGLAFGHGGVFVLQAPYLLFYTDRNHDDVPDGDPEVLLTGFGMEDAHSVANSLTWGPDGWLYGCQGSTVTARIRGIEFQQGVWRYHPLTHEFELFCEGGGNSWGLDFDPEGELIYSTNVGPHRHLHGVQGGYYWKSFGKHGALHNPYAFGFFDHIPHTNFTGGHVTVGGIIYQGTNLPARFRGSYLAGDLLGHGVQWHKMFRHGSTFTSAHGGCALAANDTWFATSDVTMGPDNAVCVADWCDQRTAHPDPDADWDRSNGRIYRISAIGTKPVASPDLTRFSSAQLISLLNNPNPWLVREARRLLADRRDPEVILPLRTAILESKDDRLALESLWALHVGGGFNERFAERTLTHRSAAVRKWTVRLIGDEREVSPNIAARLRALAETEPNVVVRSQLAATAKRLPASAALAIVEALVRRDVDRLDPYIPLLLWWAVEQHAVSGLLQVEAVFTSAAAWQSALARETIDERLMRRWTAEGTTGTYDACAKLLVSAPDAATQHRLLAALDQGFHDRPKSPIAFGSGGLFANSAAAEIKTAVQPSETVAISSALNAELAKLWRDDTTDTALIRVAARTGNRSAQQRAVGLVCDERAAATLRVDLLRLLGELASREDAPVLLKLVGHGPESMQLAALDALSGFDVPELARPLLARYTNLTERIRARTREVLLSRKAWARAVLHEVDIGRLSPREFSVEQLRVVALHRDKELDELIRKHWGNISGGTPEEKLAEMRRLNNDLNAGSGEAMRGREVFTRLCASCHALFGEGAKVGPDLTHANRADREYLLASIVDPSAVVRKEYIAHEVEMSDGRVLSGVMAEQSGGNFTLLSGNGERAVVSQAQVKSLRESAVSLMPEDLVRPLKPQELRDLFGYLQSTNVQHSAR